MNVMVLRTNWLLLAAALLAPLAVSGAGASFVLSTGASLYCSTQGTPVAVLSLDSRIAAPQTIPAGTIMTVTFSVPVGSYPTSSYGSPQGTRGSFSDNVLKLTVNTPITLNQSIGITIAAGLTVRGISNGTVITANISTDPPDALGLPASGQNIAVGIVDQLSCQSSPASAQTVDDLAGACPTAAEIKKIDTDLSIAFDGDPTAPTLVCRAENGSADLTLLQERTYQSLKIMQQMSFTDPLPWTNKRLYDWFVSVAVGIRFNPGASLGQGAGGFCCSPAGVINIVPRDPATYGTSFNYLAGQIALVVHEARHSEGYPHTCGNLDNTLDQLGGWSVQYFLDEWMAFKTGLYFIPHGGDPTVYRSSLWRSAMNLSGEFCNLEQGLSLIPAGIDFSAVPVGSSSTTQSITATLLQGSAAYIGTVAISGANAAEFRIVKNSCAASFVPPSCSIHLSFQPTASGTRQAAISITDAASGTILAASLSGRGTTVQPLPLVTSITPDSAKQAQSVRVAIFGQNLDGSRIAFPSNSGITISDVQSGPSIISAVFTVGPSTPPGKYELAVTTSVGSTAAVFTVVLNPGPPLITSVVNGASFLQAPLAPNTWFTVLGTNLGTLEASRDGSTTALGGASITVCGVAAVLNHNSGKGQINALTPSGIAGQASCPVVVTVNGETSAPYTVSIGQQSLGIFLFATGSLLLPVATHPDYSVIGPTNAGLTPAQTGETIIVWCTGWNEGSPNPSVTVGGVLATVAYYGVSGGSSGLCQINLVVPPGLTAGSNSFVVAQLPPYSLWLK